MPLEIPKYEIQQLKEKIDQQKTLQFEEIELDTKNESTKRGKRKNQSPF